MKTRDVNLAKTGLQKDVSDAIKGAIANRVTNTVVPPRAIVISVVVPRPSDAVVFDNLRVDCQITWADGTTTR